MNLDNPATGSPKTAACFPKMRDATRSARVAKGPTREQVVMAIGCLVSSLSRNVRLTTKPMRLGLASARRSGCSLAMPGVCGKRPSRRGLAVPLRMRSATRPTAQNFGAGTSSID